MCLDRVFRGKEEREALAKLPEKFVTYKAVHAIDGHFRSLFVNKTTRFWLGRRLKAKRESIWAGKGGTYVSGFHTWMVRAKAKEQVDRGFNRDVLECISHKKDVVAIGRQDRAVVVVLSHITFVVKCGEAPRKTGK